MKDGKCDDGALCDAKLGCVCQNDGLFNKCGKSKLWC